MKIINKISFIFILLFSSCGLPERKNLKEKSKVELNKIIKELKVENLEYSFQKKSINGKEEKSFWIMLSEIDDTTNFENYNNRIISAFESSNYYFGNQDVISITYIKTVRPLDIYVDYEIDPKSKKIKSVHLK